MDKSFTGLIHINKKGVATTDLPTRRYSTVIQNLTPIIVGKNSKTQSSFENKIYDNTVTSIPVYKNNNDVKRPDGINNHIYDFSSGLKGPNLKPLRNQSVSLSRSDNEKDFLESDLRNREVLADSIGKQLRFKTSTLNDIHVPLEYLKHR